jgi:hypothetical protein
MKSYNNLTQSLIESAHKILRGQNDLNEETLTEEEFEELIDEEFEEWFNENYETDLSEVDGSARAAKKSMKNAYRAGRGRAEKGPYDAYSLRKEPAHAKNATTDKLKSQGYKDHSFSSASTGKENPDRKRNDPLKHSHKDLGTADKIKHMKKRNEPYQSVPSRYDNNNRVKIKPKS